MWDQLLIALAVVYAAMTAVITDVLTLPLRIAIGNSIFDALNRMLP